MSIFGKKKNNIDNIKATETAAVEAVRENPTEAPAAANDDSGKGYRFETLQLHVGQESPDPATDARADLYSLREKAKAGSYILPVTALF